MPCGVVITLKVWRSVRLGRSLKGLVGMISDLEARRRIPVAIRSHRHGRASPRTMPSSNRSMALFRPNTSMLPGS